MVSLAVGVSKGFRHHNRIFFSQAEQKIHYLYSFYLGMKLGTLECPKTNSSRHPIQPGGREVCALRATIQTCSENFSSLHLSLYLVHVQENTVIYNYTKSFPNNRTRRIQQCFQSPRQSYCQTSLA